MAQDGHQLDVCAEHRFDARDGGLVVVQVPGGHFAAGGEIPGFRIGRQIGLCIKFDFGFWTLSRVGEVVVPVQFRNEKEVLLGGHEHVRMLLQIGVQRGGAGLGRADHQKIGTC